MPSYDPGNAAYPVGYTEEGIASWYGPGFHGKRTASGERYNMYHLTAAHKTLPFGSIVRVERLDNNGSVVVRINDRGPFVSDRIIDLSYGAAQALDIVTSGTTPVRITLEQPAFRLKHEPTFWVQVGSFSSIEEAQRLKRTLATRYSTVRIVSVSLGSRLWHRVQVGKFSSESVAWEAAEQLKGDIPTIPFVLQEGSSDP